MYEQQSLLTADLDEIIDATGHNDAQPQEQAQEAPAVKYYPIDEETARRAHEKCGCTVSAGQDGSIQLDRTGECQRRGIEQALSQHLSEFE